MVPDEWKLTKLEDLAGKQKPAVKAGPFGSALKKEFYEKTGYKVYGQEQVISNDPFHGNYYISEEKFHSLQSCKVEPGDILISLVGTIGKVLLLPANCENGIINPRLLRISTDLNRVTPAYLKYFLESETVARRLSSWAQGGTMGVLNAGMLKKLKVPLPPQFEQKKIAQILSTWDKAITTTERLLANSQLQKKALMQKLLTGKKRLLDENGVRFSGEWKSLELEQFARVYQPKTISQSELTDEGFPVYGANGLIGFYSDFNHANEQIAVTCRGSTCGLVNWTKEKSWITGNAMVVNVDESPRVIKKFIYYSLKASNLAYLVTGSGQPQITGELKRHKIKLPPINEQLSIATILWSTDKELKLLETRLSALKTEKKALMQQLLTGKRRVKVDEGAA